MLNLLIEFVDWYRARKYRRWVQGSAYQIFGGPTDIKAAVQNMIFLKSHGMWSKENVLIPLSPEVQHMLYGEPDWQ